MSTEGTTQDGGPSDTTRAQDDELTAGTTAASDDPGESGPVVVDHSPPRLSQLVATGGALVGAGLTAPFALLALPFGLSGVVLVAASMFLTESRSWLTAGSGLVLLGAVITGAFGAVPAELMLVGVASTLLGWDAGQHGLSIGDHLGRNTRSRRLQLVHTATSAVAVGVISFVVYFVYLFAGDGRPAPAVALLVLGIVLMVWMFRD